MLMVVSVFILILVWFVVLMVVLMWIPGRFLFSVRLIEILVIGRG